MHKFKSKAVDGKHRDNISDDEWWQQCFISALAGTAAVPCSLCVLVSEAGAIADLAVEERNKRLPKE
jgi:hypothetical protein